MTTEDDRPATWSFRRFEYRGGVITERTVTRPVIGWHGRHPVVRHEDGSLEAMCRG